MKPEKTKLGSLEMQLLAYVQLRKKDMIKTGEVSSFLAISSKQERELLSRMARSGLIIRLKRGVYLVPPRMPSGGRWAVSEYFNFEKFDLDRAFELVAEMGSRIPAYDAPA